MPDSIRLKFQIVTELTAVDTANHLYDGIRSGFSVRGDQVQPIPLELAGLESRTATVATLIDYVEKLFIGRRFDSETRSRLEEAAGAYAGDPEGIARTVLQIIVASPEFAVEK